MMELWPFTNFHDMNLDWIIKTIKVYTKKVEDFIEYIDKEIHDFHEAFTQYVNVTEGALNTGAIADGAITKPKIDPSFLLEIENDYVTPKMFDAVVNGVADIQAFEDMITYAAANDLNIKLDEDFEFQFIPGSTINDPTRIRIKEIDGLVIDGDGHTITMTGMTESYITSINDDSSSGRDIFTVFSVINSDNVIIENINFVGEYSPSGNKFRVQSPRAKGIGFIGATTCSALNITGRNIFGNLINATNSGYTYEQVMTGRRSAGITIDNCSAKQCYENGINFMGGCEYSEISNCHSNNNNADGVECGGHYNTVRDVWCFENTECGLSLSGEYVNVYNAYIKDSGVHYSPLGTESYGIGFRISTGDHHIARNITIEDCETWGVSVYQGVTDSVLDTFYLKNNSDNAQYTYQVYCQGTSSNKITNVILKNFDVYTDNVNMRCINLQQADGCTIRNNNCVSGSSAASSININNTDAINIIENVCNKNIAKGSGSVNTIEINNIINGVITP